MVKWYSQCLKADHGQSQPQYTDTWHPVMHWTELFSRTGSPLEWQNVVPLSPLLSLLRVSVHKMSEHQKLFFTLSGIPLDSSLASWPLSSLHCWKDNRTGTAAWETYQRSCLLPALIGCVRQLLLMCGPVFQCSPFLLLFFPADKCKRQQGLALIHDLCSWLPQKKTPKIPTQEHSHPDIDFPISP